MPATRIPDDLSRSPLFRGLNDEEQVQIRETMVSLHYKAGQEILREGESARSLWLIVRGQCEVYKQTAHAGEQVLAVLEAHTIFGEMSFFTEAPHSASVRAATEVELLQFPRSGFERLAACCPNAALRLSVNTIGVLADRLRNMDEWTCELVDQHASHQRTDEWRDFRSRLYNGWQF